MNYNNLAISIILLLIAGFLYNKFKINIDKNDNTHEVNIIKKYLLNEENDLFIDEKNISKKPILWIHIEHVMNSRKWESFGSRNSYDLNIDYIYLTLRSIIGNCGNNFNIVLINDDSFTMLLDNLVVDLNKLSKSQKYYYRTLLITQVLHKYGGLFINPSFIVFKCLSPIYNKVLDTNKMCVAEFVNNSYDFNSNNFCPNINFMGCVKNCEMMNAFQQYILEIISKDYTSESIFKNRINQFLLKNTVNNNIDLIDGRFIGTKDINKKIINLENLLSSQYLDIHDNAYCLYIPLEDLLKRHNYNWFTYLNNNEVLTSNTNVGKYLLLANN